MSAPRFDLGRHLAATPGALAACERANIRPATLIRRHLVGDWGELCPEDWRANERAVRDGSRLLSNYPLPDGSDRVWIITEAEDERGRRYCTTVLLASEY